MSEPLSIFARLKARPGQAEALEIALRSLVAPTRAEPGSLDYRLHRAVDSPDTWLLYERWASRADFDAHFERPHMKAIRARVPELVDGEVEMTFAAMLDD